MEKDRQDDWNPLEASILEDQRTAYDEMRQRCPVAHSEFLGWSLFQHDDISTVLSDTRTFSNVSQFLAIPNGMDPPAHTTYRKALDPLFDQEQIDKTEPQARTIAATLLDPLLLEGEVEFMHSFAIPFAMKTLCAVLGWPEEQSVTLGDWVRSSQLAAFNNDPVAGEALAMLFAELVKFNLDERRSSGSELADATQELIHTRIDDVQLDDNQIVSVLRNWTAGHGTVAASLGNVVLHLAQDSALQDQLRNYPAFIPAAIEEMLRADGPLVANSRTTTRAVTIHGRTIPEGERVSLMWIAANRDPRAFEGPALIKVNRNNQNSLVWGQGAHICQGAPLGRLELRVVVEELLSRTRTFEVAHHNAPRRDAYPGNGLVALPLRFC